MKNLKILGVLLTGLTASPAMAAVVKTASINWDTEEINLKVSYLGGRKEHQFTLELDRIIQSYSRQYIYRLLDSGADDDAKTLITQTVKIQLSDYDLDKPDGSYSKLIHIDGDERSRVSVRLPFVEVDYGRLNFFD